MEIEDSAAIRSEVARISEGFSLLLVLLFGSRAHGTAGEASDTDLAVLVDTSQAEVDTDYDLRLQSAFFKALGTDRIDLIYLDKATPLLRHRVVTEGIMLYDRGNLFPRYASYTIRYCADTRKFRELERQFIENFVHHAR